MTTIRIVALVALWGCGVSSGEAERSDLLIDAAPRITSVRTSDGFRQIRQNATTTLVIRGRGLAETTSVSVAALFVTLDLVTDSEVHATVFSDSATPLGLLDVTLTTATGSVVETDAVRLTPFVVSPTAVAGRGTFQSPMSLCDPELDFTGPGSRVVVQPGTHTCDRLISIGPGATITGDGQDTTILTGGFVFVIQLGAPSAVTTIRNLTFAASAGSSSIELSEGSLVVERVTDFQGIGAFSDGTVTIDRYHYQGEGDGLVLRGGAVRRSSIRHCGAGTGITGTQGLTIEDVVIEDCQVGIAILGGGAQITRTRLVDNRTGMTVFQGNVTVQDSVIRDDPSTLPASTFGIQIFRGGVFATRVKIAGQDDTGIDIVHTVSENSAQLFGDGLEIVGGRIGISVRGIDNLLSLQNSIVRGQTESALHAASIDTFFDLGMPGLPANNALSVVSGIVINDVRQFNSEFYRYLMLHGTTLNGASFAGQTIEGAAELLPYYRMVSGDSGLQF